MAHGENLCQGLSYQSLIKFSCLFFGAEIRTKYGLYGLFKDGNYFSCEEGTKTNSKRYGSFVRCEGCVNMGKVINDKLNHITNGGNFIINYSESASKSPYNEEFNRIVSKLCPSGTTIDQTTTEKPDPLVQLVEKMIKKFPETKESFWYHYITEGCKYTLSGDGGHKWSDQLIQFATTLRFLAGESVVHFVQGGSQNMVNKRLVLDRSKIALPMPSISTIKNHLPPISYYPEQIIDPLFDQVLKTFTDSHIYYCIAMDEIEISAGLLFDQHSGQLVGLAKEPITLENIQQYRNLHTTDPEALHNMLANKIMKFSLVSINEGISFPLCSLPTSKSSSETIISFVQRLVQELKERLNIIVKITSSDGFEILGFTEAMKAIGILHVFDYVHMAKNLRNFLLNNVMLERIENAPQDLFKSGFSLKVLYIIHENNLLPEIRELLKLEDIRPIDKMNLRHVQRLYNKKVTDFLISQDDLQLKGLGKYLSMIREFYETFDNEFDKDDQPIELSKRIQTLKTIQLYFKSVDGVSSNFNCHFKTTIENLESINQWYSDIFKKPMYKISHLGTNCVEWYFSTVRRKVFKPSFMSFHQFQLASLIEMVKKYNKDSLYTSHRTIFNGTRNYNANQNLSFSNEIVTSLISGLTRGTLAKKNKTNKTSSITDYSVLKDFAKNYPCLRRLTFRQSTCSLDPTKGQTRGYICPDQRCPKVYIYQSSFKNHLLKKNIYTEEQINSFIALVNTHHDKITEPNLDHCDFELDCFLIGSNNILIQESSSAKVDFQFLDEQLVFLRSFTNSHSDSIFVAIDLEGIKTGGICEIAAIDLTTLKTFSSLVNPGKFVTKDFNYCSVNADEVRSLQYQWDAVGYMFFKWLETLRSDVDQRIYLLGHNIKGYDSHVLQKQSIKYNLQLPSNVAFIDTMDGCSWLQSKYQLQINLGSLCSHYNITNPHPHRALFDVLSLVSVINAMFQDENNDFDGDFFGYLMHIQNQMQQCQRERRLNDNINNNDNNSNKNDCNNNNNDKKSKSKRGPYKCPICKKNKSQHHNKVLWGLK